MKNLTVMAFALFFLFHLSATTAQSLVGNGNVVKSDRQVSAFDAISVSHGWDLILTQGNGHHMTIEADENLIDALQTKVENGHLKIYFEDGVRVKKSKSKKIYLTFENLTSLNASGGSDVVSKDGLKFGDFAMNLSGGSDLNFSSLGTGTFKANISGGSDVSIDFSAVSEVNMSASGGSDLFLGKIDATSCNISLSGGSDAELDGTIANAKIVASGGSDLSGSNLNVTEGNFNLSGGSDGSLGVIKKLGISLGGSSDFECRGNPEITSKNISKSSDLRIRG